MTEKEFKDKFPAAQESRYFIQERYNDKCIEFDKSPYLARYRGIVNFYKREKVKNTVCMVKVFSTSDYNEFIKYSENF